MEEHTPSSTADTTDPTLTRPSTTEPPDATVRRFDPVAFVGGLVCVLVALVGLTDRIQLSATDLQWLGPLLLVGFGIVLVASAAGPRNQRDDAPSRAD